MRARAFVAPAEAIPAIEIDQAELDLLARQALIERVRRAELAEEVGAIGIIAAVFGLLWMALRCLPALASAVSL